MTHRVLWHACDYMGRCNYISIRLAIKVFPLMAQVVYHFPSVFAPNSAQLCLCIVSTEAPGPVAVKKYTQWWRILEWIAWFKNEVVKRYVITRRSTMNCMWGYTSLEVQLRSPTGHENSRVWCGSSSHAIGAVASVLAATAGSTFCQLWFDHRRPRRCLWFTYVIFKDSRKINV